MDLYRYFHPHHNPRLRKVPLRLVELGELEQAALELRRAVQRAEIRTSNSPSGALRPEHFAEILKALDYAVEVLSRLMRAHPGDDIDTMQMLLAERISAPGWENWSRLLGQRLAILSKHSPEVPLQAVKE